MREYVLLLPILFIFHDMEEIIGFGRFFQKNPDVFERFPRVTAPYRNFSTAGMALAVYEEFIPFFGVSLLAYYYPGEILNALWYGLMISLTAHFLIHIGQSIYIRKYIPSLITSIICLPVSLVILVKCMDYSFMPTTILHLIADRKEKWYPVHVFSMVLILAAIVMKVAGIEYPAIALLLWYFYLWFLYGSILVGRYVVNNN